MPLSISLLLPDTYILGDMIGVGNWNLGLVAWGFILIPLALLWIIAWGVRTCRALGRRRIPAATTMTTTPQKISFGELRASGRDVLIYCRDH